MSLKFNLSGVSISYVSLRALNQDLLVNSVSKSRFSLSKLNPISPSLSFTRILTLQYDRASARAPPSGPFTSVFKLGSSIPLREHQESSKELGGVTYPSDLVYLRAYL